MIRLLRNQVNKLSHVFQTFKANKPQLITFDEYLEYTNLAGVLVHSQNIYKNIFIMNRILSEHAPKDEIGLMVTHLTRAMNYQDILEAKGIQCRVIALNSIADKNQIIIEAIALNEVVILTYEVHEEKIKCADCLQNLEMLFKHMVNNICDIDKKTSIGKKIFILDEITHLYSESFIYMSVRMREIGLSFYHFNCSESLHEKPDTEEILLANTSQMFGDCSSYLMGDNRKFMVYSGKKTKNKIADKRLSNIDDEFVSIESQQMEGIDFTNRFVFRDHKYHYLCKIAD